MLRCGRPERGTCLRGTACAAALGVLACLCTPGSPALAGPLLEAARRGPLAGVHEIVFANRLSYDDGHWYANIGYYAEDAKPAYPGNGQPDVGRLCKLNLDTDTVQVLLDAQGGCIRDPTVHPDGTRILFAWRQRDSPVFSLFEMRADGSALRQVTRGPYDDIEPCYLPDDDIVFVSTRCRRWVNCWMTQVATLYRCAPDGGDVRRISANTEHDNTPAVLPDGRLLYTRWEYVDRSQVGYHHLWTVYPDGTGHAVYYGNQQHYPLFIETKPIPGSDRVVGLDSPGHGHRDHYGYLTLFTPRYGPDNPKGMRRVFKDLVTDPWALSEDCFLVAQDKRILLINGQGRAEAIHTSDRRCYEPVPLAPRTSARLIPSRTKPDRTAGTLLLANVTNGRNMTGVKPGDVRKLLVLESLPKPVNFSGGPDLLSWLGTFTLERALGTVPVEPDGSAHFEVPANRQLFFVALDDHDLAVKRMQSFASAMPGELTGCVGCHEPRARTPPAVRPGGFPLAARRPPSPIEPFAGQPDVVDFLRDVQPVLDRYCVRCHNADLHEGHVLLEGDFGPTFPISFYTLFARLQVADGRNGYGNQPPRTIGSSASRLMRKIDGSHHDVHLAPAEWRTLWLWLETGATFAGTYAALRNGAQMARDGLGGRALGEVRKRLAARCGPCHDGKALPTMPYAAPGFPDRRGITRPTAPHERLVLENDPQARFGAGVVVNLSRPERSGLLRAPLARSAGGWQACGAVLRDTSDPDYQAILGALRRTVADLDRQPRFGTPGFRPNPQYVREMKRYGVLAAAFDPARDPLDGYQADRQYWDLVLAE